MISFEKIIFKNILSFGDTPTTVSLNSHRVTAIRGLNSAGKSTLLEAICFGLFGKTFRKMNKPNLVNNRNGKDLHVEIHFKSNSTQYVIKRGIRPDIFEIIKDGELISQGSATREYQEFLEQVILQIDYNTFIQIVVLGTASRTSFMKLTSEQRRKFIENIFGLNVFAKMNEIHRVNLATLRTRINDFKTSFAIQKERIIMQEKMISNLKESDERHHQDEMKRVEEKIAQYEAMVMSIDEKIILEESRMIKFPHNEAELKEKLNSINGLITKARLKNTQSSKDLAFFENNMICPTCEQSIEKSFREEKIAKINSTISSVREIEDSMLSKQGEYNRCIQENEDVRLHNKLIRDAMMKLQTERTSIGKSISSLKNELLREISSSSSKIQDEIETLKIMTSAHENMLDEKEDLINTLERYEVISAILGDNGVKKTIIKQYLPAVNTLMNEYLRDLGFNAKFSIDDEFNEKIIIRGMETTYSCLSEGERQKIDLCSVLAWREASQLRARFTTNLFVADEILDGNLDSISKESFMKILKNLPDKNVFIITHDPSYGSLFDSQIDVLKKANGFSSISRFDVG